MRLVQTNGGPVEVGHARGLVTVDVEALKWLAHVGDHDTRAHLTVQQARDLALALHACATDAGEDGSGPVLARTVARHERGGGIGLRTSTNRRLASVR